MPEFRFATRLAVRRGVRLWIAGGTASGWIAACRRRLLGAKNRWNFGEIYRSTQDADLLVDGTPQDAEAIEKQLCRMFPYRRGNQCIWEVRPLRYPRGQKPAVLDDTESTWQHTDAQSLGAVELTDTPEGEPHVRDLRDWDSPTSSFLSYALLGRIRFLLSPRHKETQRYLRGDNPEIFAVIRYCSKRFQLGLTPSPEDEATLKAIVDDFDPYRDVATRYARTWLEHNGLKLLRNANDLVATIDFLERLGLRKKLFLAAGGFAAAASGDGLAYALTREPLRGFPVGRGEGPTAESLGIADVAHDTRDFGTFEAITGSSLDSPNVFQSRPVAGETSLYGGGFYVRIGEAGTRQTGYRLHFKLVPQAREHTDFVRVGPGTLLVKNREALRLVRPEFATDPDRWIALLEELPTDERDRGWRERFDRTLRGWLADRSRWPDGTVEKLEALMKRQLDLARPSATLLGYGARALPAESLAKIALRWVYHPTAARLLAETGGDKRLAGRLRVALGDDRAALGRLDQLARLLEARRRRIAATTVKNVLRIIDRAKHAMRSVDDLLLVVGERGPRGELFDGVAPIAEMLCRSDADARTLLGLVERGESVELWRRLLRQTTSMAHFMTRLRWGRQSGGRLTKDFTRVLTGVAVHVDRLSPTVGELRALRALCPDGRSWAAIYELAADRVRDVAEAAELAKAPGFESAGDPTRGVRLAALFAAVTSSRLRAWQKQVDENADVDVEFATALKAAVQKLPPPAPVTCRNLLIEGLRHALNGGARPAH